MNISFSCHAKLIRYAMVTMLVTMITGCLYFGGRRQQVPNPRHYGMSSITQLSDNAFLVAFIGKEDVRSNIVTDLAILAAATTAKTNNFPHFIITRQNTAQESRTRTTPVETTTYQKSNTIYRPRGPAFPTPPPTVTTTTTGGETHTHIKHTYTLSIIGHTEKPIGADAFDVIYYDADITIKSISDKYRFPIAH